MVAPRPAPGAVCQCNTSGIMARTVCTHVIAIE
jgi:hypothetical protein